MEWDHLTLDGTESTTPCTNIPGNHESCSPPSPAIMDIRAPCLNANSVQVVILDASHGTIVNGLGLPNWKTGLEPFWKSFPLP